MRYVEPTSAACLKRSFAVLHMFIDVSSNTVAFHFNTDAPLISVVLTFDIGVIILYIIQLNILNDI